MTDYKFECDFYYLDYNLITERHKQGTIYRHYLDDGKIDYIYGCDDRTINKLNDDDSEIKTKLNNKIKQLKQELDCLDSISIDSNKYMEMYDFKNTDYEKYYKNLSLCYLCNDNSICNLVNINIYNPKNKIGILFTFIETNKFNIDSIKLKYKPKNEDKDDEDDSEDDDKDKYKLYDHEGFKYTDITFDTYKDCFHGNGIINTECIRDKFSGGTYNIKGEITTEQPYIKHDTIMHYFKGPINNIKPVIIEYVRDETNNYFIADGNHRLAYHILNNFKYVPVIIIFKDLDIDDLPKRKKSQRSSKSLSTSPKSQKSTKKQKK